MNWVDGGGFDGGSDACPGLLCGPVGIAIGEDSPDSGFTPCVYGSQCASGICCPDAGLWDAGACCGPCLGSSLRGHYSPEACSSGEGVSGTPLPVHLRSLAGSVQHSGKRGLRRIVMAQNLRPGSPAPRKCTGHSRGRCSARG